MRASSVYTFGWEAVCGRLGITRGGFCVERVFGADGLCGVCMRVLEGALCVERSCGVAGVYGVCGDEDVCASVSATDTREDVCDVSVVNQNVSTMHLHG